MNIEPLLAVTRRLAAPVDLMTMLEEVVAAEVLDPGLLRRPALQPRDGPALALPHPLPAGAAAGGPQGRAGRSAAGVEQEGRRLRHGGRGAGRILGRPVRGAAAARPAQQYLESSIAGAGRMTIWPMLEVSRKDLLQLYLL